MKVLFISSGNSIDGISSLVKAQGESFIKKGLDLEFYTLKGKGLKGYLKSISPLRKFLKNNKFDIVHAHYSLSAIVASIAGARPLVVSLMGSDVKSKGYYRFMIRFFYFFFWSKTIVKSKDMQKALRINKIEVIPNGVDFNLFKPIPKDIALKETGWDISKKHILFAANPNRLEKNYILAKSAYSLIKNKNAELHFLDDIPHDKMPYYHNASDVLILTSLWEGSPNVIKEALACSIPIVSTEVGDVKEVISETKGCYITSFNEEEIARGIDEALKFKRTTNGRERISKLGLDSNNIANRIIKIYKDLLEKK